MRRIRSFSEREYRLQYLQNPQRTCGRKRSGRILIAIGGSLNTLTHSRSLPTVEVACVSSFLQSMSAESVGLQVFHSDPGQIMTHSVSSIVTFLCVLSFDICCAQSVDVLPAEDADGIPKSEMMAKWLNELAMQALDQRDAAFDVLSDDQIPMWQEQRREFFRRQLGGFPDRTPLNAKVTGRMDVDDYHIEKLYFESQPGLHVTATLYLPRGKGPFPAVLHPTGHSASAKNRELYQQASIVIVKGGCAVLCYDPIGQGERKQLFHQDGSAFASTVQHTLINHGMHLLGSNVARTMVWDGMRAIDYLQSRPDIIADRIGCTGISGGGTNTSYLMALDDRITAAAPGCYLTGFRSLLNTIGPQDAEQNIHGQLAFGMDHADYVLMRLPQPTLIMVATHDYFDIHGAWDLFRQGKRIATRQGFSERVELVEANTEHGFPTQMRVAASNWMRRWLLNADTPIVEGTLQTLPEQQLNATPNGRVLDLRDARSVFDITAQRNQSFAERRAENSAPEHRGRLLATVRELIRARPLKDLPTPTMQKVQNGYVFHPEPGISMPAQLVGSPDADRLVVLLHGDGKRAAIDSGFASETAERFRARVMVVDLRGMGETKAVGRLRIFDEYFGPDWKVTMLASLLGRTHVGMRSEDIWQVVRACRMDRGNPNLRPVLIATGEAAIPALHAAALEPDLFGDVHISQSIESWTAVVESPIARNQQSGLVFGALREYDLPLLRTLLGNQLTFEDAVHPDGTPVSDQAP